MPPPTSADELLRRVDERYAALTSYQDTGVVRSNWVDKPGPDELTFRTYVRKPDRIRLEWISHHPYPPLRHLKNLSVVWSNGKGTFYFWDAKHTTETYPDVPAALRAAKGVSQNVSANIPWLLVDGLKSPATSYYDDVLLIEPGEFEGTPCYRVKGHRDGETSEVWIGRDDLLIRRIIDTPRPGFLNDELLFSEEIHRDIVIDGAVADATFDYKPPPRPPNCTGDPFCP